MVFVHRFTPIEHPDSTLLKDTSWALLDEVDGGLTQILRTMSVEDSSIFLLDSTGILSPTPPSIANGLEGSDRPLRMEVRLLDRLTPSALMKMKWDQREGLEGYRKERWKEWKRIERFVEGMASSPEKHFVQGIYFFPEKRGRGPKVKVGREIAIHYKGHLPDSTVFDDSYKRGEPLNFHFGDPEQVIKGLEIGLQFMREGGRAKLVIPSYLAFGKKGGDTGILPPRTFVYYKIEVVDVKTS